MTTQQKKVVGTFDFYKHTHITHKYIISKCCISHIYSTTKMTVGKILSMKEMKRKWVLGSFQKELRIHNSLNPECYSHEVWDRSLRLQLDITSLIAIKKNCSEQEVS